jgi:hypothetical protein
MHFRTNESLFCFRCILFGKQTNCSVKYKKLVRLEELVFTLCWSREICWPLYLSFDMEDSGFKYTHFIGDKIVKVVHSERQKWRDVLKCILQEI